MVQLIDGRIFLRIQVSAVEVALGQIVLTVGPRDEVTALEFARALGLENLELIPLYFVSCRDLANDLQIVRHQIVVAKDHGCAHS